jgi:hypothetical protein
MHRPGTDATVRWDGGTSGSVVVGRRCPGFINWGVDAMFAGYQGAGG